MAFSEDLQFHFIDKWNLAQSICLCHWRIWMNWMAYSFDEVLLNK